MTTIPRPGLSGDYRDSCVVCLKGTDTGLAFTGEAEWIAGALVYLGLPTDHAISMVSMATGSDPGMAPVGRVTIGVRICATCASAPTKPMQVGLVALGLPTYSQP